jgi:ABC-2 type transport system permease protein
MSKPRKISRTRQLLTVTRYELLKYLRGRRILAAIILAIIVPLLILLLPLLVGLENPASISDYLVQFVSFMDIMIIIGATLFGADALVSEFQHKTAYLLFPNPVTRTGIFFGKYLAAAIATFIMILVFYAIVGIASFGFYLELPIQYLYSLSVAGLYALTILALAFFISSIMRGSTGSSVLTFLLFFLILPIVDFGLTIAQVKPWFSATFASGIMYNILIAPYPSDFVFNIPVFLAPGSEGLSITNFVPELNLSIGLLLLYMIFGLGVALTLFSRKEMT